MAKKKDVVGYTPRDISTVLYGEDGTLPKPFSKRITLWTGYLCGCQYTNNVLNIIKGLKKKDKLKICIENPEKDLAIAVKDQNDIRLGYIPQEDNQILLNLLLAGKYLEGEIVEVKGYDLKDNDYRPWEMIKIHLFMED